MFISVLPVLEKGQWYRSDNSLRCCYLIRGGGGDTCQSFNSVGKPMDMFVHLMLCELWGQRSQILSVIMRVHQHNEFVGVNLRDRSQRFLDELCLLNMSDLTADSCRCSLEDLLEESVLLGS